MCGNLGWLHHPIVHCSALTYMDMSPPTQEKLDTYPHVFFTSDTEWHPQNVNDEYSVHDLDITDDDLQFSFAATSFAISIVG
jgi:hypothetical protein